MTDLDHVEQLVDRILETVGDTDIDIVLAAFENLITFYMSLACSNCREELAQKLLRRVPQMIVEADKLANEYRNGSVCEH
jgi:hypothetical protein